MVLSKEELQAKGKLLDEMNHSEIVEFLKPYMRFQGNWMRLFWFLNFLALVALVASVVLSASKGFHLFISQLSYGLALFFVVLPLHEGIHGLVYKYFGAQKVLFRAEWKKLVVYAMADGFVANRKELFWVAILPFLILNSLILLLAWFVFPSHATMFYSLLLIHCSGCVGDFALINYFALNNHLTIVTYDDAEERKSYFYALET
jgi:hypothetical protein